MKYMNLGSKFFLSGVGLSVIGSSFASANPPKGGDKGKSDEKQQSASQRGSNDGEAADATEKSVLSKFFDYVKSLVLEFYYGKGYFETVAKLQQVSASAKEVLLNLNNFLDAIKLEKAEDLKELDKKYEEDEFFKKYSNELTDITKIFSVEYKLKNVAEANNSFNFREIFKVNNAKQIDDLFLTLKSSFEKAKSEIDKICKEDEKIKSSVFVQDINKTLDNSIKHLESIQKDYVTKHHNWYFGSGEVPFEENYKMNSDNINCAKEIYEAFGENFCYEGVYEKQREQRYGISEDSSGKFFDQHIEECEFLNGIRESVRNFLEKDGIDKLKEKFKSKEELLSVLNYIEERLQKGVKIAKERRSKNLADYRGAHNILLTKWRGALEYFTNVFKVRCMEAFEGKPYSQLDRNYSHFFQRY